MQVVHPAEVGGGVVCCSSEVVQGVDGPSDSSSEVVTGVEVGGAGSVVVQGVEDSWVAV